MDGSTGSPRTVVITNVCPEDQPQIMPFVVTTCDNSLLKESIGASTS
jgi:hypothetical protein